MVRCPSSVRQAWQRILDVNRVCFFNPMSVRPALPCKRVEQQPFQFRLVCAWAGCNGMGNPGHHRGSSPAGLWPVQYDHYHNDDDRASLGGVFVQFRWLQTSVFLCRGNGVVCHGVCHLGGATRSHLEG